MSEKSSLGDVLSLESSVEGTVEKDEVKDFVFDSEQAIDVDALEAFINAKKDDLVTCEEPL